MFVKAAAALLACAGLSQAAIVINSFNITGNATSTITWSSTDLDNDPTSFTIELTNPLFHTQFGVGNNIQTTDGKITFETPALLPGPNYGIQFVAINNATDIITQTQPFTVVENDVASSTVSSFSGTTTISAIQGTSTAPGRVTSTGGSTPSGTTLPNSGSTSNTPTGTSSSSTNSPSVFNGGNGNTGGNAGFALNVPAPASVVIGAVLAGFVAVLA